MNPTQKKIYNFIVDYLENIRPIPFEDKEKILEYRYLDEGHIDSFSIANFILDLEDEFNISLESRDTESDEFRTVGGIVEIIAKKYEE